MSLDLDAYLARLRYEGARDETVGTLQGLHRAHALVIPFENLDILLGLPIRLDLERLSTDRAHIFRALRAENIGVNVHYIPVHRHPFYRERFGYEGGEYPVAENAYERLISLPMFHGMSDQDVEDVIAAVNKVFSAYSK